MDVSASLQTEFPVDQLFEVVSDLSTYPEWLNIVTHAVREADGGVVDESHWSVTLQGKVGPLRRSKRIRMKREPAVETPGGLRSVRFRRDENDGRTHSEWTMKAIVEQTSRGSTVEIQLHYGGSLWVPVLDRLLTDEIESSKRSLALYLASR